MSDESKMMSDEEYAARGGDVCPHCGDEDNLTSGNRSFEQGEAYVDVDCGECGRRWTDVYELKGWQAR